MTGPLSRAAEELEDRVEAAEEAAAEAAETNHEPPPPPDHTADLDLGERIGRLEAQKDQPVQDPRVDGLLDQFGQLIGKVEEALTDSVSEVEDVTPEGVAPEVGAILEPVEQAPKRVHAFLKRLW